jgi:hypothetical protein
MHDVDFLSATTQTIEFSACQGIEQSYSYSWVCTCLICFTCLIPKLEYWCNKKNIAAQKENEENLFAPLSKKLQHKMEVSGLKFQHSLDFNF